MKSVLPFLIIIHHTWIFEDFKCVGVFVVSLFFFISGYGQECKREIKEQFSLRELLPIIRKQTIPLVIPSVIYVILLFTCQGLSMDEVIVKICRYGLVLPYTWFIVSLWLLYFVFYSASTLTICFKYVVMITAIGIAASTVLMALGHIQSTYHMCNFAFLAGIIYRGLENNGGFRIKRRILIIPLLLLFAGVTSLVYIREPLYNSLCIRLFSFAIPIVTTIIISNMKTSETRLSKFLSKISYEVYVCQGITFLLVPKSMKENIGLYIAVVFILTIMIAYLSKAITDNVFIIKKR